MWQRHWNLSRSPFEGSRSTFATIPGHVEAVARLVHTIRSGDRSVRLMAGPGLGKSMILARALEETRTPRRRLAQVSAPADSAELYAKLAVGLGGRIGLDASKAVAWRTLVEAVRLCRLQDFQVVLAVDDVHTLKGSQDLDRLGHLDPEARLIAIRSGRPLELATDTTDSADPTDDWGLVIRVRPLTRSEVADYLAKKLDAAGRADATFTHRAISRIHALSGGVPRGIDRLASLALMASAVRGLEIVTPDVVDDAAGECRAIAVGSMDL